MLVIKVFVNEREIDTIYIHNQGHVAGGIWQYRLYHDSIPEEDRIVIRHKRDEGYIPLLKQALIYLDEYRKENMQ